MFRVLFIIGCCVALAPCVTAADDPTLEGRVAKLTSDTWTIAGLESGFELTTSGLNGEVRMARITLLASDRSFEDVRVGCTGIVLTTHGVTCDDAAFTATIPGLGRESMRGTFAWNRLAATTRVTLRDIAIAGGRVSFEILASDAGIEASYSGSSLRLDELMALAARFTNALAGYSGSGQVGVEGSLVAPADGPLQVVVSMDLDGVSLANDAGTVAAADVTGRLDVDIAVNPDSTRFDLAFDSAEGEAYLEPVYSNFSEHALHLRAADVHTADFSSVKIDRFELRQDTLLDASGSATVEFPSDEEAPASVSADVRLRDSSVAALYTGLVQVQLAGTLLGALDAGGRVSGTVQLADNALRSAALELDDVILDDRAGRFAVYGLDGAVNWTGDAGVTPPASRISWDSGTVYNLIVGAGDVELQLGDNDIELLQPARLPFAGGALRINQLALQGFGDVGATGRLDAELEPVQLGQLTGALGWPAFSGELSGRLPLLQLAEDEVTVGGDLNAQFFDGTMTMSNLRIERPFGRVPRLYGDVSIRNLDLERVTETFSFGYIQGRLSGDVTGLKLENWRPVAMDMYFYTPPDDRSQHRISQRAVENLASVGGGGAGAVLSTGFLRFFEVFSYDRIGLRCRLGNGVCAMSGAGPAKPGPQGTGYYIVKGRGVPRIDVVGYRDKVSWPRLVQQLSAITRSGAPTVD
ncbi:MAG: hypothetical protein V2I25_02770 [Woeseiaceae bacterium]|jgi:hypothetical protein|nr:hypothetical protein [Woeseiaceae bacterium]